MKPARRKEEIADALRRLATTYAHTIQQFEETLAVLCRELDLQEINWTSLIPPKGPLVSLNEHSDQPIADSSTLSVQWQGFACFLGNTLLFRFFDKLSHRPNRYFPYNELLNDVWGGQRSHASVRNVVKRLRDRLSESGMTRVANAIDGSVPGHYALLLDRLG